MRLLLLLLLALATPARPGSSDPLDQLLQRVQNERRLESERNAQRLQRFNAARDEQQKLLAEAEAELKSLQARGQQLLQDQMDLSDRLQSRQRALEDGSGDLTRLRQAVRQSASRLRDQLQGSLVSAQFPGRGARLMETVNRDGMPSLAEIESLWQMQLEELVESGRVTRFQAEVINRDGEQVRMPVIRIGTFNLLAEGSYLRYLPSAHQLVEPQRQPSATYREMAAALEVAAAGSHLVAIDPSRGDLLQLLARTPALDERIREGVGQGGVIGGIILTVGAAGLLLALGRLYALVRLDRRIRQQMRQPHADPGNPLGRILQVYLDNPHVDTETLGLKLDEAILKELPRIKWGLGSLSVMAAIAPLLGLLGTVTGIIETFQSITLYGGGDPRIMSGGISQALVTTVEGLVVAIPLMLLHSFLSARSNSVVQILDEQSAAMVARLAERQIETGRA